MLASQIRLSKGEAHLQAELLVPPFTNILPGICNSLPPILKEVTWAQTMPSVPDNVITQSSSTTAETDLMSSCRENFHQKLPSWPVALWMSLHSPINPSPITSSSVHSRVQCPLMEVTQVDWLVVAQPQHLPKRTCRSSRTERPWGGWGRQRDKGSEEERWFPRCLLITSFGAAKPTPHGVASTCLPCFMLFCFLGP